MNVLGASVCTNVGVLQCLLVVLFIAVESFKALSLPSADLFSLLI